MHKLLFIHPDRKLQEIYKHHLVNYFFVDSAYDGLEGLKMIRSLKPNLVVSEYHLPSVSGLGLLEFVRNRPDFSSTPFIFFSSSHPTTESMNLGANDWLQISDSSPEQLIKICFKHIKLNQPKQIYV